MAAFIFASRITLIAINLAGFIFACLIIFYGSAGLLRGGKDLEHPFAGLVALGVFIMIFSICGIFGACCAVRFKEEAGTSRMRQMSSRALMVYYTGILLTNAGLLYASMLCFLFAEKATDYIDAYWSAISPSVCGSASQDECSPDVTYKSFKNNSNAGGVVALLAIFVNFFCAHCSAVLMGYKYTMRKSMLVSNFCGMVLAIITMVIGFLPGTRHVGIDQGWLPPLIGFLGIILLTLCMLGFVAAFRLDPPLFFFHYVSTSVAVMLLFSFGVYCLADADNAAAGIRAVLPQVKNSIVDVCPNCGANMTATVTPAGLQNFTDCCYKQAQMAVWNNLTLLGVSSIVSVLSMLINIGGSIYLRFRVLRERRGAVERGEVDDVTGQPTNAKTRQGARADAYHAGDDPDDNL